MDCNQNLMMMKSQSLPPLAVPPVYKAPYFSKGYQPLLPAPKPLKLPIKLKEYLEEERRATLTPEEAAQAKKVKVPTLWPDLETAIKRFQCPSFIPREEDADDNNPPSKPSRPAGPPPGVSRAYWKLKTEKYGEPPSPSKFRKQRFSIDEIKKPRKFVPFPLYESPSSHLPSRYIFTPKNQKRKISYHSKLLQIKKYAKTLKHQLDDWTLEFSKHDNFNQSLPMIPEDRVNYGCERVRALCDIAPPVVYTIVKKFVTGPPHNNLFWLNRTEAVECWGRIVGPRHVPKKCCVQAPVYQYPKMQIDSLKRPPMKVKKIGPKEVLPPVVPCTSKPSVKKSKKQMNLEVQRSIPKIEVRDEKLPPFCDPIPPPELRLPWHIPPLKPKDGDDKRKTFKVDRTIDLDDIIPYQKDRYGHDRRKQKWIRDRIMREAMTQDFFNRTDVTGHFNEVDMIMSVASLRKTGNIQSKKDIILSQSLKRGERENTAALIRQNEVDIERKRRNSLRNRVPDYSQVRAKFMEPSKRYRRYSFL